MQWIKKCGINSKICFKDTQIKIHVQTIFYVFFMNKNFYYLVCQSQFGHTTLAPVTLQPISRDMIKIDRKNADIIVYFFQKSNLTAYFMEEK